MMSGNTNLLTSSVVMNKYFLVSFVFFSTIQPVCAQWAVYDDEVKKQLVLVNKIGKMPGLGSDKSYDHYESERGDRGDIRMGSGDNTAILKGLETRFERQDQLPELTQQEMAKYVGSEADCGQEKVSPKHFEACMGLRNLRIQTIVQSQAMLKNLAKRREQIVSLIKKSRELPETEDRASLGQLQRATFEIQGQQALMQADALHIQVLMDGYKQREAVYTAQQAEARKATDARHAPTPSLAHLTALA